MVIVADTQNEIIKKLLLKKLIDDQRSSTEQKTNITYEDPRLFKLKQLDK